jgi:hypothetical protein
MSTDVQRFGRRRLRAPLEAVVIGVACLACCLPLLGGALAAVTGALAK